ncbi:MAG: hypothetical protein FWD90_11205 [Defluviitaleaceae bacterium]|nr:hypothetical protein [Defluviitaleaceae bacterium]
MLPTVIIITLVVAICAVSLAAIGSVVWMRKREQERDQVLQSADALATLDDALDEALKELNKIGNLVQKEISEKYQAMLFLYNLLEEKQKAQFILPENIKADLAKVEASAKTEVSAKTEEITPPAEPEAEPVIELPAVKGISTDETLTNEAIVNESVIEAALQIQPEADPAPPKPVKKKTPAAKKQTVKSIQEVAAVPAPRKRTANPKHEKVRELEEKGVSVADIAKELGIGQGEIRLILEMTKR